LQEQCSLQKSTLEDMDEISRPRYDKLNNIR
jgi:hypothetical protein